MKDWELTEDEMREFIILTPIEEAETHKAVVLKEGLACAAQAKLLEWLIMNGVITYLEPRFSLDGSCRIEVAKMKWQELCEDLGVSDG